MSLNRLPIRYEGLGRELFTSFYPTTSGMRSTERQWCDHGKTNPVQHCRICDAAGTGEAAATQT